LTGQFYLSIFDFQFATPKEFASPDYLGIVDLVQRLGRFALIAFEIVILSALILTARCANFQDVFVGGDIYFTDADCYARMTRVRLCAEHSGLIIRHHEFENFPAGTTPHTTAPLDYLILLLSILLKPFTNHAVDLAGALISPLLALIGGWFLWWWSRRMKFRFRWALLVLYAISPILVHGSELGRPDHQSLSILLVTIALCAEWAWRSEAKTSWNIVSGVAWGLAIWVSAYEPLILLLLLVSVGLLQDRHLLFARDQRIGWLVFGSMILVALAIERRIPAASIFQSSEIFWNWSRTIGELLPAPALNPVWFRWGGYMIVIAPILLWLGLRKKTFPPLLIIALLIATYCLTIWQSRWSYFFLSIFAIALPSLLEPIKSRAAVWIAFTLSIFPILRDWDEKLWPNEPELARRIEHRHESIELRELAVMLRSSERHVFLAPWWLSPAIAYWSGQPGVAGSSHESLEGIADSARFFLSDDWHKGRLTLQAHEVAWIFAYDADRVAENSATLLGAPASTRSICRFLNRTPAQAPSELVFSAQNGTAKLFRFANNR
jgi:hypothetical protein